MGGARRTALVAALALVVLACGGSDAPAETDTGGPAAEPQPEADEPIAAEEGDDDAGADAGDDPSRPTIDRVIDSSLAGEDGWGERHDLDIPPPGSAVLEMEGRTFEFEVQRVGTGVITDDVMDGNLQLNDLILFNFAMRGPGQSEELGNIRIDLGRSIHVAGDRAIQIRNMEGGGEGKLDMIGFSGVGETSSRMQSPSSVDPEGARLPVVRVSEDGIVTAQGDMTREFASDTDAFEGPFTFAGRCQDTWPDDQSRPHGTMMDVDDSSVEHASRAAPTRRLSTSRRRRSLMDGREARAAHRRRG